MHLGPFNLRALGMDKRPSTLRFARLDMFEFPEPPCLLISFQNLVYLRCLIT